LVGIYATEPDQSVFGAPFQATADAEGRVSGISLTSDFTFALGIWANSMEGTSSHVKSIGYFKIVEQGGGGGGGSRDCSGIPDSVNMIVSPNCAPAGGRFAVTGLNFQPGESVGRYYTSPTGRVIAGSSQSTAESDGRVTGITFSTATSSEQGIWVATFEGVSSHRRGLGYFKVTAP
jgi:hypothetical protein